MGIDLYVQVNKTLPSRYGKVLLLLRVVLVQNNDMHLLNNPEICHEKITRMHEEHFCRTSGITNQSNTLILDNLVIQVHTRNKWVLQGHFVTAVNAAGKLEGYPFQRINIAVLYLGV
jgi:hypothetical protein